MADNKYTIIGNNTPDDIASLTADEAAQKQQEKEEMEAQMLQKAREHAQNQPELKEKDKFITPDDLSSVFGTDK